MPRDCATAWKLGDTALQRTRAGTVFRAHASRATCAGHPDLSGTLLGSAHQAGFVRAVFGDGDPNADYEARRWAMMDLIFN